MKYVPAETLAFFVPVAAFAADEQLLLVAAVVAGLMGTVGWLWLNASGLPKEQQPLVHFYVLAAIAFVCWSLSTAPSFAGLLGVSEAAAGVILLFAVFLIPLADGVLTRLQRPSG